MEIRRLLPEDAVSLVALRREALESHPLAFGATIDDDRGLSLEFMRTSLAGTDQAVFGAFEGDNLVGMVGIVRATREKVRHKAHIWGMYVASYARRKGAGRALLEAAIGQVREWPGVEQLHLGVTDAAVEAKRLYETAGFRVWGRESRALQWEGRFVDELFLVLDVLDADVG